MPVVFSRLIEDPSTQTLFREQLALNGEGVMFPVIVMDAYGFELISWVFFEVLLFVVNS